MLRVLQSAFRPIGVIGWGSIPLTFVGSVALLLVLLRYACLVLILSVNDKSKKEVSMVKTLIVRTRIFLSSIFETIWASGVGIVVGHLST